jgi:hypothetical protein
MFIKASVGMSRKLAACLLVEMVELEDLEDVSKSKLRCVSSSEQNISCLAVSVEVWERRRASLLSHRRITWCIRIY